MTCLNWGPDNWSFSGSLAGQTSWDGNTLVIAGPITVDNWDGTQSGAPELLLRPVNLDQTQEIVLNRIVALAHISNDDFSSFIDWAFQWRWDTPPAIPGFDDAPGWSSTSEDNTQWGTILSIIGGTSPLDADKTFDSDASTTALDGNTSLSVVNSDWRLRLMPAGIGLGSNQALRISDLHLTALHTCSGGGPAEPEPPTEEQIFRDTFSDVSGRDPLPTSLTQRKPAQDLANHNVNVHRHNPRLVSTTMTIRLGEFVLTSPAPAAGDVARMMWFPYDKDDPVFNIRPGRWAQVIGRGSTDIRSGEMEVIVRIADNPESFIPPGGSP